MAEDSPRQITVSRDALRADLLELEDRLKTWFGAALALKANADHVDRLETRLFAQERGDWTKAQTLAVKEIISLDDSNSWALKSNKMAWTVGFASFGGLALGILAAVVH